jgi:general secretion pathway protein H
MPANPFTGARWGTSRERGFTLLELLVVMSIVALATAGATLALRDSSATQLEREGLRLAALLDAARAQSRTTGIPVSWRPTAQGFEFQGLRPPPEGGPPSGLHTAGRAWLDAQTQARIVRPADATALVLGPEPLIPVQRLELSLGERRLGLETDGLGPFRVVTGNTGS